MEKQPFISRKDHFITHLYSYLQTKGHKIFILEILVGTFLSILSMYLFYEVAENVLNQDFHMLDVTLSEFIYQFRSPQMTLIMQIITNLISPLVVGIVIFITMITVAKRNIRGFVSFILTLGVGFILNTVLKYLFSIPRPELSPLLELSSYSFPSAHAMISLIFYGGLSYFIFTTIKSKLLALVFSLVSVFLIFLIGFSRVYLGVHYPSDILAGYLSGSFWLISSIILERTFLLSKIFKQ